MGEDTASNDLLRTHRERERDSEERVRHKRLLYTHTHKEKESVQREERVTDYLLECVISLN
jgi:hypothetical protein